MEALERIRQSYKDFSKTNRKIADVILRDPKLILSETASEIAIQSDTSAASIVRFTKILGFSGLEEFKLSLAIEQGSSQNKKMIDPIVSADDTVGELAEKVEALISSTLNDMKNLLVEDEIEVAIEKIRQAETVYLLGIGASSLTAYNLYHKLNRAGKKTAFCFDAHMNLEFINYATEKDVVIAISYSGQTREVLLPCRKAKENNCHIIFITKNNSEEIQNLADTLILVPDNEHVVRIGAISSIASSMAIGDILFLGSIQAEMDTKIPQRMIETNDLVNQLKKE